MRSSGARSKPLVISACLAGVPCRYDGQARPHSLVQELIARGESVVLVCPEELGGLGTPRPRAWLEWREDGRPRVTDEHGRDVTAQFERGAELALEAALEAGADTAILKQHSPSCGCGSYGSSHGRAAGEGVTARLFLQRGLRVIPDDSLVAESLDRVESRSLQRGVESEEHADQGGEAEG